MFKRAAGLALIVAIAVPGVAAAAPGPKLGAPVKKLRHALTCNGNLRHAKRTPVLLVHGTFADSKINWSWNYKSTLPARRGQPACTVDLPELSAGDIQPTSEYVVYAIRAMARRSAGKISVIGPNNVNRNNYDFNANKSNIVAALNEYAKALTDLGLTAVLHQHTGTCVESRDETYAVMEAVDTRYVKFGPDIGQLQKGGADPVQVVKDFLPLVHHMHLKDFIGGEHFAGYCPLGQGKVDLKAILDMVEGVNPNANIMVELDGSANMPYTALQTAQISKAFLQKLGYTFRTS